MRLIGSAVFLFIAATAAAQTFQAESDRHVMSVTRSGSAYIVAISERGTSRTLGTVTLDSSAANAAKSDLGDIRIVVRLVPQKDADAIFANVIQNGARLSLLSVNAPLPEGQQRTTFKEPYPVGGDVRPPKVVRRVEPAYPVSARAQHIAGVVILNTEINERGEIEDIIVLKGPPELVDPAVAAVSQWKFDPATMDGKPVRVVFNLTVNFKLN